MPAAGTTTKKSATTKAKPEHPPYKDMIKEAILQLKERNGSSRQALKKYILANFKLSNVSADAFNRQFNSSLKKGVADGEFFQPKGPSGTIKLQKKEAAKSASKPAKVSGDKPAKKATTKKAAAASTKKTTTTRAAKPKATAPKTKAASANSKKPRKTAASGEKKPAISKTKTGRVSKASTNKSSTKKTGSAATKKKVAPKKKADATATAPAAES